MMKLYSGDLSPYAARVRMQIYAKGIQGIVLERPAAFGTPQYREENPIGRLPVLEIDGDRIPESGVIAQYLEEVFPTPSLLGKTPRESAHIRTLERIGDIYLMNNMFMLAGQAYAEQKNQGVIDLLGGQVVRNLKALDRMIGTDGFAACGRLTLADCALVPALFMTEYMLGNVGVPNPLPKLPNVAAWWAAIQENAHAARVLVELRRGYEERQALMRSGEFAKQMAVFRKTMAELDAV